MATTLAQRLESTRKLKIAPDDKEWIQFMKDHREHILEKSSSILIDYNDQNTYRYRLFSYLVETSHTVDLLWIILWLNQLDTEMDFNNVRELYIPDYTHISELYQTYRSFRAKYNKESKVP
jgi:hypothetical protein